VRAREQILDINAVLAEANEGDDLASDNDSLGNEEDENFEALNEAAFEAEMDQMKMLASNGDGTPVLVALDEYHYNTNKVPDNYTTPKGNPSTGLPEFGNVDNPGNWPAYTFFPRFVSKTTGGKKRGDYSHHATSTGATPVPVDNDGDRKHSGWKFYYNGWTSEDAGSHRSGATATNLFPDDRKGRANYPGIAFRLVYPENTSTRSRQVLRT
jgi:hypothetical protein